MRTAIFVLGLNYQMSWYSELIKFNPTSSMISELISAVENLPQLGDWKPANINSELHRLLSIGLHIWGTLPISGAEDHYIKISNSLNKNTHPPKDIMAELSAAALCMSIGCIGGARLEEGSARSADWRLKLIGGELFDLEVAKALPKPAFIRIDALAHEFGEEIIKEFPGMDIAIHIIDMDNIEAIAKIKNTIKNNQKAGVYESESTWQIVIKNPKKPEDTIIHFSQESAPQWWPQEIVRCVSANGQISNDLRSQCVIYFGVPYDSYLNLVQRKAERSQGDPNLPFLIAVDVAELPGGLNEIPRAAREFLPFWDNVSGVLLFQHGLQVGENGDKIGWLWKLLENDGARIKLPSFRDVPKNLNGRQCETWYELGTLHVTEQENNIGT